MFHILMFQHNSIKTRQNLHVNVAIAYKENDVLCNVQSHLKRHKSKIIVCVENDEP
jgi:hypothetical protein